MTRTSLLHFVVALPCEAKPLIAHFRLTKISTLSLPFPIFVNTKKTIYLIVSGVGKIRMAAATTFLHHFTGSHSAACFCNIGIAGASQFPLGTAILVNKIIEYSTQRCWYPFINSLKNMTQSLLTTHDLPQSHYPANSMVDMEGSAFFQTASCFVTQEQIQLLKIISDGHFDDQQKINAAAVQQLLTNKLADIQIIANYLMTLSENEFSLIPPCNALATFQSTWHFTHHQTLQLKEYLRRWKIQCNNQEALLICQHEKNAAAVIKKIAAALENTL